MKKNLCLMVLYFAVISNANTATTFNSVVPLVGGGTVSPATSLQVSLNGLVPSVTYNVVCYIDTTYPFQYILLGSSFADTTSKVFSYSLNGNYVMQDQLIAGHNIVVVTGNFTDPTTGFIVLTNLDQSNTFNVNNCFGVPTQVPSIPT